ncbi:MAG: hypothetical protein ACPGCP_04260 [Candidatus Nanopelagicales bacterium]
MVPERWLEFTDSTTAGAMILTLEVDVSINSGDDATVTGSVICSLDPESMVTGLLNSIVAYG